MECVQACHKGAIRMKVSCCSGISKAEKTAMLNTKNITPYKELFIGTDGWSQEINEIRYKYKSYRSNK